MVTGAASVAAVIACAAAVAWLLLAAGLVP